MCRRRVYGDYGRRADGDVGVIVVQGLGLGGGGLDSDSGGEGDGGGTVGTIMELDWV